MPDYRAAYDEYWQRADRVGEASSDLGVIADLVAETCGVGTTLDVGSGEGFLVGELLRRGVDALGIDVSEVVVRRSNARWPGRFRVGTVLALPYANGAFHTLVSTDCLEHLTPEDVRCALREMNRVSSRFVFLQVATTPDRDARWHLTVAGREWWEACCFAAGFRKHPAYYAVNPYEALNRDAAQIYVLLEKMPVGQKGKELSNSLQMEQLLHRDMLRESGRRSDAHCIRYVTAAQYIRPGDVVLDVACGLGYGSHVLLSNSQARSVLGVDLSESSIAYAESNYGFSDRVAFRVGDAEDFHFVENDSVDFIAAFETIEHVARPAKYLGELKRVLKPSGRLMICAPNNWVDETGKDPNPYHLQVYTWDRLRNECGEHFLLEKAFLQTAGGAMKCQRSPRKWREVDPNVPPTEDEEWLLFLCMKDPLDGSGIPYVENEWQLPKSKDFHVAAFARDYTNPWLVKGIVTIGQRSQSPGVLRSIQKHVIETYGRETADFGAALCGFVYDSMRKPYVEVKEYEWLTEFIREYARIRNPAPHQLRWQVSLLFAGAELARVHGNFIDAKLMYEECAGKDVMAYSPLLGNRILDALHWLAIIAVGEGLYADARSYLLRAVRECRRLSSGSWLNIGGEESHPIPFGYAEMAQLMDKGSRAAYMLLELDNYVVRPRAFVMQASGFLERQLIGLTRDRADLAATVSSLKEKVREQERISEQFAVEVAKNDRHAQELAREIARQDAHAQALAQEVAEKDRHAQELAREVRRLREQIAIIEGDLAIERNKTLWQHAKEKVKRT